LREPWPGQAAGDLNEQAECLEVLANTHGLLHHEEEQERYLLRTAEVYRELGDMKHQAQFLWMLAGKPYAAGDVPAASRQFAQVLSLYERADDTKEPRPSEPVCAC